MQKIFSLLSWKNYFLDKERMLLFIALAALLPLPFCWFMVKGFVPAIYSMLFGFRIIFTRLRKIDLLISLLIIYIPFCINCYLLKMMVFVILKPLKFLVDSSLVRKVIISLFIVLLILFACLFNIYRGDSVISGQQDYNLITLYKDLFTI